MSTQQLTEAITSWLDDGKANDIVTIDLKGKTDIADFMIIASGTSSRHTSSLADKLLEQLKKDESLSIAIEGKNDGRWVLIDIGDIIIHIFQEEAREIYQLEKMWNVPAFDAEMA